MKISQVKGLTWVAALAVGGYLAWYVTDFLEHRDADAAQIPREVLEDAVQDVAEPEAERSSLVAYSRVTSIFHNMDWRGAPPPPPPKPVEPAKPPTPVVVSAADLVNVVFTQSDSTHPERGFAMVTYKHKQLKQYNERKERQVLRPTETLPKPFDTVSVRAVNGDGILFAFADGREDELVGTLGFPKKREIVVLAPGEEPRRPKPEGQFPKSASLETWRPKQTMEIRKNEFQLGTDTVTEVEADYSRILARDLSYKTHRDPQTGRPDGVQITNVTSGSVAASHGLTAGEVIKSINGHPVTSVTEGVSYVKSHVDSTDTWLVVFEKQGKEFTRTYHSPKD